MNALPAPVELEQQLNQLWVIFEVGRSGQQLILREVGRIYSASRVTAPIDFAERHSRRGVFVALTPKEAAGRKVDFTPHAFYADD